MKAIILNDEKINIETTLHHFLRNTRHCVSPVWGNALFFLVERGVFVKEFRATTFFKTNSIHIMSLGFPGDISNEDAEIIDKMFSDCPAHVEAEREFFIDGRISKIIYRYYDL